MGDGLDCKGVDQKLGLLHFILIYISIKINCIYIFILARKSVFDGSLISHFDSLMQTKLESVGSNFQSTDASCNSILFNLQVQTYVKTFGAFPAVLKFAIAETTL